MSLGKKEERNLSGAIFAIHLILRLCENKLKTTVGYFSNKLRQRSECKLYVYAAAGERQRNLHFRAVNIFQAVLSPLGMYIIQSLVLLSRPVLQLSVDVFFFSYFFGVYAL